MSSPDSEFVQPKRKTGQEPFRCFSDATDFNLLEFWQWSASDLISNATRGRLAEFIIAKALGADIEVRMEWAAFDLRSPAGTPIEVKSCAYIQSWSQHKYSSISFGIRKTRAWDYKTGRYETDVKRQAKIYIFSVLAHTSRESLDPLDLAQWEFYPVLTRKLDERLGSQHAITLRSLREISDPVSFQVLAGEVERLEQSMAAYADQREDAGEA